MNEQDENERNIPFIDVLGGTSNFKSHGTQVRNHPSEYASSTRGVAPTQCEVCGSAIPPTRTRCNTHSGESTPNSQSEYEKRISHVAITFVPALTELHAVAIGSSAYKNRNGAVGDGSSFDLIYDFDDPSSIFTSGWGGELPDAVPVKSELGGKLIKKAKSKMGWETEFEFEEDLALMISSLDTPSKPYIFSETGNTLDSEAALEEYLNSNSGSETTFWAVPAVLYKTKLNTTGKTIRNRECANCGIEKHVFRGYEGGHPDIFENGSAMWACLCCSKKSESTPPRGDKPQTPWNNKNYTDNRSEVHRNESID